MSVKATEDDIKALAYEANEALGEFAQAARQHLDNADLNNISQVRCLLDAVTRGKHVAEGSM